MAEPTNQEDHTGGERPVYQGTELEWVHDLADCMRQAGFAVTVDESVPTFLAAEDLPADQVDAYNEAVDKCREELGSPAAEPFDPDKFPEMYEAALGAKICLEKLGYTISDPPSLEVWIETYETGPWLPHSELPEMSEEEWERVNSQCPQ